MYRSSSVIFALQQSSVETIGLQFAQCPLDICFMNPAHCQKGQTQTCIKEVAVLYTHDNHNKEVNLRFFFTVSSVDFDGFIDEDNEFLQLLIRRNIINQNLLQRV
ncbi:hypothetical protein R84B8_01526 [Treponema sp. R8-4-B8]